MHFGADLLAAAEFHSDGESHPRLDIVEVRRGMLPPTHANLLTQLSRVIGGYVF